MDMLRMDPDFFVPFLIFSIPIVAIVGGITAGIVRTIGNQRLLELAQRERIAAIERGIDPAKLTPLAFHRAVDDPAAMYLPSSELDRRRSASLMVGGVIVLFVGVGVSVFLWVVAAGDRAWGVGLVPIACGLGLLLSSWLIRPRGPAASA